MGVDDNKETATVSGLEQGYIVCPSEKRLQVLFTFLKKNRKKKVMVFFSSCMSVKYHNELFNYIDLPVTSIHVSFWRGEKKITFVGLLFKFVFFNFSISGKTKANQANDHILSVLQC